MSSERRAAHTEKDQQPSFLPSASSYLLSTQFPAAPSGPDLLITSASLPSRRLQCSEALRYLPSSPALMPVGPGYSHVSHWAVPPDPWSGWHAATLPRGRDGSPTRLGGLSNGPRRMPLFKLRGRIQTTAGSNAHARGCGVFFSLMVGAAGWRWTLLFL